MKRLVLFVALLMPTPGYRSMSCPFCGGDGVLEVFNLVFGWETEFCRACEGRSPWPCRWRTDAETRSYLQRVEQ